MGFALKQENEFPFLSLVEGPMLKVLPGGKAKAKPLAEIIPTTSLGGGIIPFDSSSLELRASSLERDCAHDKVSNVTQKKNPNGATLSYVYDALNRLTTKTTPEQVYAFGYDTLSRLTSASNTASNLSFAYDAVGQLLNTTTAGSQPSITLSYSYDEAGRKTNLSDPTGSTAYEFDRANRLTSMTNPYNNFAFTYDKGGRRTGLTGSGGIERTYSYDNINRLLSLINKVNGKDIDLLTLQRDAIGNKTQKTDSHGADNYTYDQNQRLLSSSLNSESFIYRQVDRDGVS
ncbi:MAG: RHS repeat protein [Chlamydiae bacterium]|nr:RHS repeat protein [Chlamydiota bacterium]MBI3277964.1 RHS repeat protein [Chlamydiota bacterium]